MFLELAKTMLEGGDKSVVRLLEQAGKDAIIAWLGGRSSPFGLALSVLLKTGQMGEIDIRKLARAELKSRRNARRHADWLRENSWRFDWRSQPRVPAGSDAGGEWTEGRLDYPVATKAAISRRERQRRRRTVRAYRQRMKAAGYSSNRRGIMSSWSGW